MIKNRFSKYNDGMLYVCEAKKKEIDFGAAKNTRKKEDLKKIVKLAYEERTKREEDLEFAENRDRSLSIKVKTRLQEQVKATHKVLIENVLYSIIYVDLDKPNKEMYLYLEEEREIR